MALGTIFIFGGLGILFVPPTRKIDLISFLVGVSPLWKQVGIGVVFGFIAAKAGWQIVELPRLARTKIFFVRLIKPIKLNIIEILLISLCAGIGEEFFFRGVLQPWLGIWITAFAFVMLHGYLNPFNLPLTGYGFYMVLVIAAIGYMTEHLGIVAAMTAHTVIDVVLLRQLSKAEVPPEPEEKESGDGYM